MKFAVAVVGVAAVLPAFGGLCAHAQGIRGSPELNRFLQVSEVLEPVDQSLEDTLAQPEDEPLPEVDFVDEFLEDTDEVSEDETEEETEDEEPVSEEQLIIEDETEDETEDEPVSEELIIEEDDASRVIPWEPKSPPRATELEKELVSEEDWKLPSDDEFARMVEDEILREAANNITLDMQHAMEEVMYRLLRESPIRDNSSSLLSTFNTAVHFPNETTPQLLELEQVCFNVTNTTTPKLKNAEAIKDFIKEILNEDILAGREPNQDEIYHRLEDEMGVDRKTADALIVDSPKIRKYLKTRLRKAERLAIKKELKHDAEKVAKVLIDKGHNGTDLTHAIKEIDNTLDELGVYMKVLGPDIAAQVEKALEEPELKLKEKVEAKKNRINNGNHTYIEDTGETNEEGHRVLRFVPHPSQKSMKDHKEEILNSRQRRRLNRKLPKDTADFHQRLKDHVEELNFHVRELRISCSSRETNSKCMADHLVAEMTQVNNNMNSLQSKLDPLDNLLAQMSSVQDTFEDAADIGEIAYRAVQLAKSIPGPFRGIFTPVERMMRPIRNGLSNADTKAQRFESQVVNVWDRSIGRVEAVMALFDENVVRVASQGAKGVAFVQESQCAKSLINAMAGSNIMGTLDNRMGDVKNYINTFSDAVKNLNNALAGFASKRVSLQNFINSVAPLQSFFRPFKPLADLLQKEITLPWFSLPYSPRYLGRGHCYSGYKKGGFPHYTTCWENESNKWEEVGGLSTEMQYKCSYGGMQNHWMGGCKNHCSGRSQTHYRSKVGWFKVRVYCPGGYKTSCPHVVNCMRNCAGHQTEFCNECCNHCPYGYSRTWDGGRCERNVKRAQYTHGVKCSNYNWKLRSGEYMEVSTGGDCYSSCARGDRKFLGECFPPSELKVSVSGVFDALGDILDFIEGLPIVSEIMGAIDSVVGAILRPITNQINRWLRDAGILPPAFPSITVNSLNFNSFNSISLPTFPQPQAVVDAAERLNDKMLLQLPSPLKTLGSCGASMECVAERLGMGSLDGIAGDMVHLLEQIDLNRLAYRFNDAITKLKCTGWASKTVDVSRVLDAIGVTGVNNACDILMPYCRNVDFGSVWKQGLRDVMQPIKTFLDAVSPDQRRRLASRGGGGKGTGGRAGGGSDTETWIPIFSVDVQGDVMGNSIAKNFGGTVNFSILRAAPDSNGNEFDAGEMQSKPYSSQNRRNRLVGLHLRGKLGFVFELGMLEKNGLWAPAIKFGPRAELKFGQTGSARSRMIRVQNISLEVKYYRSNNPDYERCRRTSTAHGFCGKINVAVNISKRSVPWDRRMDTSRVRNMLEELERLERVKEPSSWQERRIKTLSYELQAISDYWESAHNDMRKAVQEAREIDTNSSYNNNGKLMKTGINFVNSLSKLKVKSEWLTRLVPISTASASLSYWNDIENADDLIQLAVGIEMEDSDTGTRLGPIFQFKPFVDGTTFAGWNVGELRVDTIGNIARQTNAHVKRTALRDYKRSLTEYTDSMYSVTAQADMLALVDFFDIRNA